MTSPVVGIAGWKNSGKTTLLTKLLAEMRRRGFRVATVKHAHHDFDIDHDGTDSFRHRAAGAVEVAVVSTRRWALIHELGNEAEPALADILAKLSPSDIVIVEGYKDEPIPKIEVRRRNAGRDEPLAPGDPSVLAIAADHVVLEAAGRPVFLLDDVAGIAAFIITRFGLGDVGSA